MLSPPLSSQPKPQLVKGDQEPCDTKIHWLKLLLIGWGSLRVSGVWKGCCLRNDNKLVAVPASGCPLLFPGTGIFNGMGVYAWWPEEWFLTCQEH